LVCQPGAMICIFNNPMSHDNDRSRAFGAEAMLTRQTIHKLTESPGHIVYVCKLRRPRRYGRRADHACRPLILLRRLHHFYALLYFSKKWLFQVKHRLPFMPLGFKRAQERLGAVSK
jgi:hypothetical protein